MHFYACPPFWPVEILHAKISPALFASQTPIVWIVFKTTRLPRFQAPFTRYSYRLKTLHFFFYSVFKTMRFSIVAIWNGRSNRIRCGYKMKWNRVRVRKAERVFAGLVRRFGRLVFILSHLLRMNYSSQTNSPFSRKFGRSRTSNSPKLSLAFVYKHARHFLDLRILSNCLRS